MNEFHIDRQQGVAIWFDVDKGIVTNVRNAPEPMNTKMFEKYNGKSINTVKADIESEMLGKYSNLRSTDVTHAKLNVLNVDVKLNKINEQLNQLERKESIVYSGYDVVERKAKADAINKEQRDYLEKSKKCLLKEKTEREETLENVQKYVKQIHGYES